MLKVPYAFKPRDHELDHSRRITSVRERKVVIIIVLITCVTSQYIQSPNFITTFKTPRWGWDSNSSLGVPHLKRVEHQCWISQVRCINSWASGLNCKFRFNVISLWITLIAFWMQAESPTLAIISCYCHNGILDITDANRNVISPWNIGAPPFFSINFY